MSDEDFRLDNPMLVRWEFASEERLEKRNQIYRQLIEGVTAEDYLFQSIKEFQPSRVLEVGCGAGAMAQRVRDELGTEVVAVDSSERMVELTRQRGIEAYVADVTALPFGESEFDCVFAGWVLYHVLDRDRAISECARVLEPGGRFTTATLADENMSDLWDFLGSPRERSLSFSSSNGAEQLERQFAKVEAREAEGTVVFPTAEDMRQFVAANMTRAHLAATVPAVLEEPVKVRTHHTIFVADKAA
jgi:ubiquinone/menaquinone biosynthesis C-methylase UbiE